MDYSEYIKVAEENKEDSLVFICDAVYNHLRNIKEFMIYEESLIMPPENIDQLINDENGTTLVSSSSVELKIKNGGNVEGAKQVGADIAKKATAKGIKAVVFDRGGYQYHGRVAALAESARENGLEF